ncbi:MAG: NAD(P)/FAD-dependent oxidoreductase, partial [Muribaculaceae bacterium]|nr:NAD(P)/FAD-dependent oxidoreductase [Muribaculaceae bacterium]
SDSIVSSLSATIRKFGGKVIPNSKVTKIICNETKAVGVEVNNHDFMRADLIIADIHPARVMEILETKLIRPAFRNRMSGLKNTTAGFSLYLKFKDSKVPYLNSNYYSYKSGSPWNCEDYTDSTWPKGYLYMHFCNEVAPKFASSGVVLSYMNIKEVSRWANTPIGRRGESYEAFKKRKAEILINEVNREFPGFKDSIESYYTATPLTYQDYTGTQDGSMYGVAKDITLGTACRVSHKTKIPNLLLTGQNVNSHGMLGVLVGSIVTCSELLSAEMIYQQIIEANR